MWEVTLTAVDPRDPSHTEETTVRIYSDHWYDLLKNEHFRWGTLEAMLRRGSLKRIHVDYRPNFAGVRRVRKDETDGLWYLYVDEAQFGQGYQSRREAWEQGDGVVRATV